jgi:hypothetical protein
VVVNGNLQWGQTEKQNLVTIPIEKSHFFVKNFTNGQKNLSPNPSLSSTVRPVA